PIQISPLENHGEAALPSIQALVDRPKDEHIICTSAAVCEAERYVRADRWPGRVVRHCARCDDVGRRIDGVGREIELDDERQVIGSPARLETAERDRKQLLPERAGITRTEIDGVADGHMEM